MTDTLQFDFVRDQKTELPVADTFADKISGGTFIVTGSNTGLGFEAAQHFVRLGAAKLILAVRSTTKGEEAKSRIETSTGIKGVAEVWELDMSSYSSIVAFGKKLQGLDRLDAIVENAAVALDKWSTADKGFETTMIVNVTGTMLLAGLVMPKLQESAKKFGLKTHLSIIGSGVAHFDEARDELQKAVDAGGDILNYFNVKSHGLKGR
jgi:NAD(P)-dependent dehydrogenase (short-subunit alcohol dehydrogenase family)